jgi:hypothetical protein
MMALVVLYCSTGTGIGVCGGLVPARPGDNARKRILALIICRGLGESLGRGTSVPARSGAKAAELVDRYQMSHDHV